QARYEYLESNDNFSDRMNARRPPPGAIPREGRPSALIRAGLDAEGFLASVPPEPIAAALLERGRARYETHCAVCHGSDGYGSGIVVRRGFPAPPSFHGERLRAAPLGHIVNVIENGYGIMYPYRERVKPEDRWAIAAYIRVLQLSQFANVAALPEPDRARLEEEQP